MIKVRFATKEDAKSIANLCSKAWKVTYADIYSKEYIDHVIDEFYNVERIAKESSESSFHCMVIWLLMKAEEFLDASAVRSKEKQDLFMSYMLIQTTRARELAVPYWIF